ncbi:MAG: carbamoyl-phosphate synthase (glutamine-hydrolyzing) large subunit [Candidatus Gastranaerophilales bacterium]|nr:carbamoyl-phosphate synthase (glutamine-hydrolyzing) large subunit [Candidatus Gastranaerophilales bacterium]
MPKDPTIKKVIVIGSGPIIIGQAAEFDYAGTQACKSLREEGIEVVLLNSNPATIMTDDNVADRVYLQPLNIEALEYIIERERPDGILAAIGGQTGLNLVTQAYKKGILEKSKVRILGTSIDAIQKAEDRESFKNLMLEIGEPVAKSEILEDIESAVVFAQKIGYPIVIRPAFTLAGTGGGIAYNEEELRQIMYNGLAASPIGQVLAEESVAGWKEIEYEVMRDANDTAITVCNMENIDPVGIHTGDSIVVAPSQTLSDKDYQKLRAASLKIIRALKIEGGCNVQFAFNPKNSEYVVIEVNPRVSRSSALASKAAGYPIAKVTAKIAIGMNLHEIPNYVTGKTKASFEPALDYVVVKIPKWPFDKFGYADRRLGTQMKATGEVMAIDRTFESAFLKALICLEGTVIGFRSKKHEQLTQQELINKLKIADDERIYAISSALRRNMSVEELHKITQIDKWFLYKFENIINTERQLKTEEFSIELLKKVEGMGFTDDEICSLSGKPKFYIDTLRRAHGIYPVHKMVDTCAAEFEAQTPYYYSTYEDDDENIYSDKEKVIVIGSGPIRIGQGIEFDYCSVHAIQGIKDNGYESIIINNNPETVSTDFDIADKLYFEPLFIEDVSNVIRQELPKGVILQFGGQTALNLAPKLLKRGVQILGTSVESINVAEDRKRFEMLLKELKIKQPKSTAVTKTEEALKAASKIGYPILLRPSYVTGGRAMKVVYNDKELISYMREAVQISPEYPVAVDQYIEGKEFEVDMVCDKSDILIPGITEHIERAGVHSGDSFCVYPPRTLSETVIKKALDFSKKIAKALQVIGLMNIQFIAKDDDVYVIEVNPRASRTVPIMSKVTKVPMVKLAVNIMFSKSLKSHGFGVGLLPETKLVAVKAPVFSFQKLPEVDVALNAEMKSTGEVLGIDSSYEKALIKAFMAAGTTFAENGIVIVSVREKDMAESLPVVKKLQELGFTIAASDENEKYYSQNAISVKKIDKNDLKSIAEKIKSGEIKMIYNLPEKDGNPKAPDFKLRELSAIYKLPCFTCTDTIKEYLKALEYKRQNPVLDYKTIEEYM